MSTPIQPYHPYKPSYHVSLPYMLSLALLLYIWWFITLIIGFIAYFIYTILITIYTLLTNPLSLLPYSLQLERQRIKWKKLPQQQINIYSSTATTQHNK